MKKETAESLICQNIQTYNQIAEHFCQKRKFLTQDLVKLSHLIKPGERILDIGCANGRFCELVFQRRAKYWGIDVSEKMISIARRRYPKAKFFVSDFLSFPFGKNFFDKVYCLSVFHHIPSKKFRIKFLQEIKRVLKPGGIVILTIWNLGKKRKIKNLLFKYTLKRFFGKSGLDFGDLFLPWKNEKGEVLALRYFHVFSKKELVSLVKEAGFEIKKSGLLERSRRESNIFVIAQKPKETNRRP
ncbi:methyltransferase domain-containing protein [bacterium]|nr:methyltransferase domain-containing protein [bacterium]